ncbi:DUF302 domain-containing protein [Cryobacterium sp. TMT2-23]|uniref:DUF302 domain-containing protein n=1 Tax=Cryobacterium sp. TMT2-23 TaxID=1259252 RepID=UPI00106DB8EF|nr:DUF302 domain-containing protein [Cryobacterium sp. TMT2-23]TFD28469.1 DUF302 domain-containing protein [Cryobacterium sp. TMT2-23]
MTYAHTITVDAPFDVAVQLTRVALAAQGFGVLSEIDVHATFAEKLGADAAQTVGDYLILGACNPGLARRAIMADPEIGALLPCNVVVRRGPDAEATTVQAINPAIMVQLSHAPEIASVAADADSRLRAALLAVQGGPARA